MGIIIGDTIELQNGLSVTNSYGSVGYETVTVTKQRNDSMEINEETGEETIKTTTYNYILRGRGVIWATKELRNGHKPKLKHENIAITYDDDTFLSQNVYTLLYNKWKTNYTTVTDDL
jgi:hypothetical protein